MSTGVSLGKRIRSPIAATGRLSGKQVGLLLVALLLSTLAGYTGYQRFATPPLPAAALQTTPARLGSLTSTITATGSVVATRLAKLSFSADGKLVELNVAVGANVKAGQPLARQDTAPLRSKLISAESSLKVATFNLEKLKGGATPEELEAAKLAHELAVAKYQEIMAGPTEADRQAAQSAVEQATANLASAQAKLDDLKAGPTEAEMLSAQAAVSSAKASLASARVKLEDARAGPKAVDLNSAQAAVESARSALASAQEKLDDLKAGPTASELASAQASVEQAKGSLISAEDRYEMVKDGNLSDAGGTSGSAVQQAYNTAKANYETAVQKLRQLQEGPTAAELQSAESGVTSARSSYDSAVAKLEEMKRGTAAADLASAESAVEQASASLASAEAKLVELQAGPTEVDIASAASAVEQAKAALISARTKLSDLLASPKEADILSAKSSLVNAQIQLTGKTTIKETDLIQQEEQVRQAEAALEQARLDLESATMVGPFDGIVSAVAGNAGERVSSGAAVVTVMDPTAFRIDVTVDETDRAKLAVGQPVVVSLDAMPDRELRGQVIAVAPAGTTQQGVVSYASSIGVDLSQQAEPSERSAASQGQTLRARTTAASSAGQRAPSGEAPVLRYPAPGMSATVTIETERKDGVVLVPNRAVRTQGRNRVVDVMVGEKTETRTVQTGSSNDQMTEIISGVVEGEIVVIPATTIRSSSGSLGGAGGPGGPGIPQPALKVR